MFSAAILGHFHPLLVHLPIGILLFAAGLMVFGKIRKTDVEAAVSFAWAAGAFTAILSCVAGWLLAQSGEYDVDMVQKHQWTGIITAALATITFLIPKYRWLPAAATVILLTIAGHYGGNLTHGEGYLFGSEENIDKTNAAIESSAPVAQQPDSILTKNKTITRRTFPYRDEVVPILKNKCYNCHAAAKKKGGLRLDSEAFIKKGGKNGTVIKPGKPQQSKLYTYLLLPEGDDRHMPPKGKLQLNKQEISTLYRWIQTGAPFQEKVEVIEVKENETAEATAEPEFAVPELNAPEPEKIAQPDLESEILARKIPEADPAQVQKLKENQVVLTKMSPGSGYVSANFVNTKTYSPEVLNALQGIQDQVMRLRLTGLPVQDADVKKLTQFKNLTRLNLEKTSITDQALSELAALPNLEQLNLYNTGITDKGLESLKNYPNLKFVYLWQTKTTQTGIANLQKARPDLKIESGGLKLTQPDTTKAL